MVMTFAHGNARDLLPKHPKLLQSCRSWWWWWWCDEDVLASVPSLFVSVVVFISSFGQKLFSSLSFFAELGGHGSSPVPVVCSSCLPAPVPFVFCSFLPAPVVFISCSCSVLVQFFFLFVFRFVSCSCSCSILVLGVLSPDLVVSLYFVVAADDEPCVVGSGGCGFCVLVLWFSVLVLDGDSGTVGRISF
ncbi:hypothetical protein A2U01_0024771 [Trifolium medium]|uniref:Transmembrane protein n=1 Tax=Trifolium medium TaxID=97028 RepID=A0A392NWX4_9FABA|nr:hypothetical protein [Trifolium medium]